tara:strand:- start:1245 stop:1715 length:471 start_codon:yes stop_codon:yes gene_type:complete
MSRKSRESENLHQSRDDVSREETWVPASLLEAPPARPGFKQRWISTSILGKDVPQHTLKRFREGWTPRKADTVSSDFPIPSIQHGQYAGVIGVEGLILCELSNARVAARGRYFAAENAKMQRFVDENLNKVETQGGHAITRTNESSVSHGQRIADD